MPRRRDDVRTSGATSPPELRQLVGDEAGRRRGGDRRLFVPKAAEPGGPALFVRVATGSLGLTLLVGIALGMAMSGGLGAPAPEIALEGPGRLNPREIGNRFASAPAREMDAVRSDLLATGLLTELVAERGPLGGLRVRAVEKRAVALLDGSPPLSLAADGTVLGPATAADLEWVERSDLPVVGGGAPGKGGVHLAGALAAVLEDRPGLDRLVSEINVQGGPLRVEVVLRPSGVEVALTAERFVEGLEVVDQVLPALLARWPALGRIDARLPDRLFLEADGDSEGEKAAGRGSAGGIER